MKEAGKFKPHNVGSLKHLAVRGAIWTLVGYGGSQVLRLGGNIILTRLLVPELFGLMALVNTFILGLNLFSDIGIRPSIIRSKRADDPKFLNTAWTLQVIRGFVLWIVCLSIALPIANFYGDLRLLWLLPIIGLTTIISGFNSTSLASLNRKIEIGKLTRFEFGTQAVALTVMITWAYFHRSIWALVAGNLIASIVKMTLSHRLELLTRNWFSWDKNALKELISFGRWIFISTAMTFLASQADRVILGKLFTLEMLGIYTIAFTLADVPRQVVSQLSAKVMYPLISKNTHLERSELRTKILQKRWLLLVGLAVLVAVLAGFGDLLILLLYDRRYQQAAWMLPILAVGLWPLLLSATIDRALYAIGKPQAVAFGNFLKFLYMLVCLPIGFKAMGVAGAILVVAFNDFPGYAAVNYGLWGERLSGLRQDMQLTLVLIGLFGLAFAIRFFLGFGLPFANLPW